MSGNAPVCSLGTLGQHFQAVVVNVITSLYIMTNEKNNKHNYILYETSLRIKRKKNHSKLAYKSWPIGVIAIAVLRGRLIFFYSFILMKRSCSRLREAMLPFNMFWIILNWTFRLPPKRQLSILLNFFAINKFVFDFCCLCLLCYNAGHHAISRQKHGI